MARFATRFKGQEVVIKDASSEFPWMGTIRSIYSEADTAFYEVESEGELISVAVLSVEWIKPRKAVKVLQLDKLNVQPLRLISGGN